MPRVNPVTKVCIICGKSFETIGTNAALCSDECRLERRRQQKRVRNPNMIRCAYCGKEFPYPHTTRKFCSDECRYQSQLDRYKVYNMNREKKKKTAAPKKKTVHVSTYKIGDKDYAEKQKAETLAMVFPNKRKSK